MEQRERESNGFPEEHTRKIASERERKEENTKLGIQKQILKEGLSSEPDE